MRKVETGDQFGKWTVIRQLPSNSNRKRVFECQCACGTIKPVIGYTMYQGRSKGCSCSITKAQAARRLSWGESAKRSVFRNYQKDAHKRSLAWALSSEEFYALAQENCHYCGCPPHTTTARRYGTFGTYTYNGIDRLDPEKGYAASNCVACCWTCNRFKQRMNVVEFLHWIRQICCYSPSAPIHVSDSVWKIRKKGSGLSKLRYRWHQYVFSAKRAGRQYSLSKTDFANLALSTCHYCGGLNGINGIDRVDNSEGYTVKNCASCCTSCNYAKNNMSKEDFLYHARCIYASAACSYGITDFII